MNSDKVRMATILVRPARDREDSEALCWRAFLVTTMIASVSSSIAFWIDWNKAREDEQERILQKVASELAILKLQVSPHFLFNTLNNIRWLIRSRSERAEEAVVKLSQLLRYILYQTNDEKVHVGTGSRESNRPDLAAKMRLNNEQSVEFTVTGDATGKTIIPLLFVPLIENFSSTEISGPRSSFAYHDKHHRQPGDLQNRDATREKTQAPIQVSACRM